MSHSSENWLKYGKDSYTDKFNSQAIISDQKINELIIERKIAKDNKNYSLADQIRNKLLELNIILEDKPDRTDWRKS